MLLRFDRNSLCTNALHIVQKSSLVITNSLRLLVKIVENIRWQEANIMCRLIISCLHFRQGLSVSSSLSRDMKFDNRFYLLTCIHSWRPLLLVHLGISLSVRTFCKHCSYALLPGIRRCWSTQTTNNVCSWSLKHTS